VERGIHVEDFSTRNVPSRVTKLGDLWAPLNRVRGRFDLEKYV
jgi:hypothetical protein